MSLKTAVSKRHMLLIFICLTLQVGMEPEKWQQETLKNKFTCKVCILHQHPAKKWGYLVFPKKKIYIKDRIWKNQKLTGYISLSISEFCQGYYILQIYPPNGYIPGYISLGIYILHGVPEQDMDKRKFRTFNFDIFRSNFASKQQIYMWGK